MSSFFDSLRAMVGLKKSEPSAAPKKQSAKTVGAFGELSAKFLSCENEEDKAALWDAMCKALPDTLFLAAMCYEGDDPAAPVRDRDLHATVGAKRYYALNESIVTRGNPGYRLAKKADPRRIHLRSLVYHKSKEEWVPLFTDFTKLLPVFGQKSRVTLISFEEARQMAKPYAGLVINPGPACIKLSTGDLKKTF